MTFPQKHAQSIKAGLELPWWFTHEMPPVNNDFEQRVVCLPEHARWHSTQLPGIDIRVLEYLPGNKPRLTAQIRLDPSSSPAQLGDNPDLEILVQRGELESAMGFYPAGLYLRLPITGDKTLQTLMFRCTHRPIATSELKPQTDEPALLYLAAGQMLTNDTEQRILNTADTSRWLPGPVEGTEVLPLHGHESANVMLIKWTKDTEFKPGLDPMGEEMLVLNGLLYDTQGYYSAGSWIRNPIKAWQTWSAKAGTLVYYKNGHVAAPSTD